MATTKTRLKTQAAVYVPQSRDDAAASDIRAIGGLKRIPLADLLGQLHLPT